MFFYFSITERFQTVQIDNKTGPQSYLYYILDELTWIMMEGETLYINFSWDTPGIRVTIKIFRYKSLQ